MNIKQLIRNQKFRHFLMKCGAWLPDSIMLPIQYRLTTGRWLHLKNPKRFTEKIQWYKSYYRNPLMLECVDKYKVRNYVTNTIGNEYLIQLYGVYNHADEIRYDHLPNQFVIKTTDGGSGDNVLICQDKHKLDLNYITKLINSWKNKKYYIVSREWAYLGAKDSKIIVEELLGHGNLNDYKFFCFNGKIKYFKIDIDRFSNHKANYYYRDFTTINVNEIGLENDLQFQLPDRSIMEKMISVAEKLSSPFPFVRVDLYLVSNKIYFGEMTFYPGSGYIGFSPDDYDYIFGEFFKLEKI